MTTLKAITQLNEHIPVCFAQTSFTLKRQAGYTTNRHTQLHSCCGFGQQSPSISTESMFTMDSLLLRDCLWGTRDSNSHMLHLVIWQLARFCLMLTFHGVCSQAERYPKAAAVYTYWACGRRNWGPLGRGKQPFSPPPLPLSPTPGPKDADTFACKQ